MKILLKRDSCLFPYHKTFGSTLDFSPSLFVGGNTVGDIEPAGSVMCTVYTADKVKSSETGKVYDHTWLWTQMIQGGKVSASGAAPQDAFAYAVKGQKVIPTGEIETSAGWFQVEVGPYDFFTNVKSYIQLEYNKGFKRSVGVGTEWFNEYNGLQPQSVLPHGKTYVSDHEWQIVGWDEAHPNCFIMDSHQGSYRYVSQDEFNYLIDATYGSVVLGLAETTQEIIDALKAVKVSLIQRALDVCYNLYKVLTAKLQTFKTAGFPPLLYTVAKNNLGKHLTLNDAVSPEVGCAEALSALLKLSDVLVPVGGIASTTALYTWLQAHPRFVRISEPEVGAIIISPTTPGAVVEHGHVGVIAMFNLMYKNDYGIMSNDSDTGTLREKWNLTNWINYYQKYGGLEVAYFRLVS